MSDAAKNITALIGKYYRNGHKMTAEQLLDLRRRLAAMKYALALETGELYKGKNETEFRRKAEYTRRKKEALDGGANGVKSEIEAEAAVEQLRKDEHEADATHKAANLILDSAKDVLDALSQHIANLRQEKRDEMTGQGSQ